MIKFSDGVFEELVEASYIANDNEAAAHRFLDACDDSFERLEQFPEIGTPNKLEDAKLTAIRMWVVKGFDNYLIFYHPIAEGVRILHVLHSSIDYKRVVKASDL